MKVVEYQIPYTFMLVDFKVFLQTFEKNSFEPRPSLFFSLSSLSSPSLPCFVPSRGSGCWPLGQRCLPVSCAKGQRPDRPRRARGQIALPCPESTHARRARGTRRLIPDGRASLRCAAPSSTSPLPSPLLTYKRKAGSPYLRSPRAELAPPWPPPSSSTPSPHPRISSIPTNPLNRFPSCP
jgi:hypothetical protein